MLEQQLRFINPNNEEKVASFVLIPVQVAREFSFV